MVRPLKKSIIIIFSLIFFVFGGVALAQEKIPAGKDLGIITGQILLEDGSPFPKGFVAFFKSENADPMDYGSTRRSPKMIAFLQEEGKFTTHLMPSGSYFVGAMMREGWRGGPPKKGEKRYSAFDDKGEYVIVTLASGQTLDIGKVKVREPELFPELEKFFTIKGRLLDDKGKGIFGSVVVVKEDYTEPKALFISDESAINGSYEIKLPPGKYYILARETVEGSTRPKPGSIYGELGQDKPVGIGGKTTKPPMYITGVPGQEYNNVDITMFEVPIPDVKRKETEEKVRTNQITKDSLPDNLPMRIKKSVDTVPSKLKAKDGKK